MCADRRTVVDFVARGDSLDDWKLVLVEEGPWLGPIDEQLRRIQGRLYGCIDAVLDGHLASEFPESKGKSVIVQMDCYNVPRPEVEEFFGRFSAGVLALEAYRTAIANSEFARGISFAIRFGIDRKQ